MAYKYDNEPVPKALTDMIEEIKKADSLTDVKNFGSDAMQYLGYDKKEADETRTGLAYMVMDIYNATDMDILMWFSLPQRAALYQ